MSALLSANEIRLTYGYQTLLDGVTLAVSAGEKTGMVGRNGCGKTSLLKILTGQQMADSGEISLRRALRVGYLPQEFELGFGTHRAGKHRLGCRRHRRGHPPL